MASAQNLGAGAIFSSEPISHYISESKTPPLLGANGGGWGTGYGARIARDRGRCRPQWPAKEVKGCCPVGLTEGLR
jgi:hypothetical protein